MGQNQCRRIIPCSFCFHIPYLLSFTLSIETSGNHSTIKHVINKWQRREQAHGMEEWAMQYGAQEAPGIKLYSEDRADYQYVAQQEVIAGQAAIYVLVSF